MRVATLLQCQDLPLLPRHDSFQRARGPGGSAPRHQPKGASFGEAYVYSYDSMPSPDMPCMLPPPILYTLGRKPQEILAGWSAFVALYGYVDVT